MNRKHALALLLPFSLGLGDLPGSAAADPVESDTFKFTWLGIPIGEVTLHYGRYEDPNRAYGSEPAALEGTSVKTLERQSYAFGDNEHEEQKSVQWFRLGALEGRTNGLVRWLKRYEGAYRTVLTPGGSRYEVKAMDQGASELRDVWFGAKHSDIPKVLDFRDRSRADPLQPLAGVDERSVDPVRLMALILYAIESHKGCPTVPKAFRVFDGKRRYEAHLSEPNWTDTLGGRDKADTNVALESSVGRDLPPAASRTTSTVELSATESNAADIRSERVRDRANQDWKVDDHDLHERMLMGAEAFVAQESEELMGRGLTSFVPQTVECQLTLYARDAPKDLQGDTKRSEVTERRKLVVAEPSDQSMVDPMDLREQKGVAAEIVSSREVATASSSREIAESHSLARETENEERQQSPGLTMQHTLFWPFNRQALTVDFSVSFNSKSAKYHSFLIRAPVGHVRGRLANGE